MTEMHTETPTSTRVETGRKAAGGTMPTATVQETLGVVLGIFAPSVAKGAIIRRPRVVALAERLELDLRAVRRMQRLRNKYGPGPLMLRIWGRSQALILSPDHVHRVLEESPDPFSPASTMKRAALAHFEPEVVLISEGGDRAERRRFNEEALDTPRPAHRLSESFLRVVAEEAGHLKAAVRLRGGLAWDEFSAAWFRVVRRIVLGDGARDDHELTEMIAELRVAANWAFLRPQRHGLRERFFDRINGHICRAEAGSLAAVMAATPVTEDTAPLHQVSQWLFAFDPAGMTTFRALALLAAYPDHAARARAETAGEGGSWQQLPLLRATILESLRLWPTTPLLLRQTTAATLWETGVMPASTGILIFAPFFHRDDERLVEAHTFSPEQWLQERTARDWPLIPFSAGPAICPGRNLVLLVTSAMLAALISDRQVRLTPPTRLDPRQALPGTLDSYSLRFGLDG